MPIKQLIFPNIQPQRARNARIARGRPLETQYTVWGYKKYSKRFIAEDD